MAQLIRLPRDIWCERVATFLQLSELVRIDSATINRNDRAIFQQNIFDCSHFPKSSAALTGRSRITWRIERNILPRDVYFVAGFDESDLPLQQFLSKAVNFYFSHNSIKAGVDVHRIIVSRLAHITGFYAQDCAMTSISPVPMNNLMELRLGGCHNITDERFLGIISLNSHLKSCFVRNCAMITSRAIATALARSPALMELSISGGYSWVYDLDAVLAQVEYVRTPFKRLSCCGTISTSTSIAKVAAFMPNLQELSLSVGHSGLENADIQGLAQRCPHLRSLELIEFTNITMQGVAMFLSNVRVLDLSAATNLSDAGVIEIATYCPRLLTLCLVMSFGLSDASIREIGTRCTELTSLMVSMCLGLTDRAFETLNTHVLQRLDASGTAATGAFLSHLLAGSSSVQALTVMGCVEAAYVDNFPEVNSLLELNMTSSRLPVEAWVLLSTRLPSIEKLCVALCANVDDAVVRSFVQHCPHLKAFHVKGCPVSRDLFSEFSCLQDTKVESAVTILTL